MTVRCVWTCARDWIPAFAGNAYTGWMLPGVTLGTSSVGYVAADVLER